MSATIFTQERPPFLAFVLAMIFIADAARAQSKEDLREQVMDAWRKRQDTVESADFRIRSALALSESEIRRRAQRLKTSHGIESNPEDMPQGDTVLVENYEVAFDGDKLRYSMAMDESTREIAKSVGRNMTLLSVTNGTDYRCLESFPDHGQDSGVIQNSDQFLAFRSAEVRPILLAFRAVAHQRHQRIKDFAVVDGKHQIDGRSVVVLKPQYDGASLNIQYWADPSREFVVLRILSMAGGYRVGSQVDIEYEQDKSGCWVPIKWDRTDFASDGGLRRAYEFEVVEYEINPNLPKSLFELEFEPGVEVFDKRNGPNRANIWIVNEDGTKTMKRGVDPDLHGESSRRSEWLLGGGVFFFLLVLIFRLRSRNAGS